MSSGNYQLLKALLCQAEQATRIHDRENAIDDLLSKFRDIKFRRRLANESSNPTRAMRAAARLVLRRALNLVHQMLRKKQKHKSKYLTFPYSILQKCYYAEDYDPDRLSVNEVMDLYKYCVSFLNDETRLNEIENLEQDMLNMLDFMCAKREFVAYFKPDDDLQEIVEIVRKRLPRSKASTEANVHVIANSDFCEPSAKALCKLFQTLEETGVTMQYVAAPAIDLVSEWCVWYKEQYDSSVVGHENTMRFLLSTAVTIMRTLPDRCIAMLRQWGQPIFGLVRKSLGMLQSSQPDLIKACVDYLQGHL